MGKTYVLAVSGGIDSVVMLDMLVRKKSIATRYIVGHINHGIRQDSSADADFVSKLASRHNLIYEQIDLNLGVEASEENARIARYAALEEIRQKHNADGILVAHHQDDVLETMLINILRGTGPRGLVSFNKPGIERPLIDLRKSEILDYAKVKNILWREDSTNTNDKYLRNYIRNHFGPSLDRRRSELLEIRSRTNNIYKEIDELVTSILSQITDDQDALYISKFVIFPNVVQKEIFTAWLKNKGIRLERKSLERVLNAVKTQHGGSVVDLNKYYFIKVNKGKINTKKR